MLVLAPGVSLTPDTSTRNVIQPTGDFTPLVVRANVSQSAANLQEWQNSAGTALTLVSPRGFITLQPAVTDTSGTVSLITLNPSIAPAGAGTTTFVGINNTMTATGGNAFSTLLGYSQIVTHNGGGAVTSLSGGSMRVISSGGATVTTAQGCFFDVTQQTSAATITTAVALDARIQASISGGIMTTAIGVRLRAPTTVAGASIPTMEGIEIGNQGSARVTTSYALRILAQSGSVTATHAIRSEGGQNSFLAGAIGTIPLVSLGASGQTASLQEWQNNSGTALSWVEASGTTNHSNSDAGTTTAPEVLRINHVSSGTPAAGFGCTFRFRSKSSTTADRDLGCLQATWATATDATRKGRVVHTAADNTADREYLRGESNGTVPMIGFLGGGAVVQQAGASAAGIAAVLDPNAAAALTALQAALAAYTLVTSPA